MKTGTITCLIIFKNLIIIIIIIIIIKVVSAR